MRLPCSIWSAPGTVTTRISNPTTAVLEERVAALEGGVEHLHGQRHGREPAGTWQKRCRMRALSRSRVPAIC